MQDTSIEAHRSIEPKITLLQARVLAALSKAKDGLTDEELTARLADENRSTYRTRRSELVRLGLVKATGERRPLRNGRMAHVWRAV